MILLDSLKGRLPPLAVHSILLLAGTTISQFIPALVSPIITRLYTPASFGIFSLTYAILAVVSVLACLRYELAIVLPAANEDAASVIGACLTTCLTVASVATTICIGAWALAPSAASADLTLPLMATLPVGVLLMGCQTVSRMWCVRTHRFGTTSVALLVQAGVTVTIQAVAGALWGSNPYFLIAGIQIGLLASVLVFFTSLKSALIPLLRSHLSVGGVRRAFKEYSRFPIYTAPYVFITQAAARIVLVVIAAFATKGDVGQFALAQRVTYLPLLIVLSTASQIFFSRAAQGMNDPRLAAFVRRAVIAGSLLFVPCFMIGVIFAAPVFVILFGANWSEAGRIAAVLAWPSMMLTLTSWLDRVYDIQRRQRLALILQTSNDVISLSVLTLLLYTHHSVLVAIGGFATIVSIYCVIWTYFTFRVANINPRIWVEYVVTVAVIVAAIVGAYAAVAALSSGLIVRMAIVFATCLPFIAAGAWVGVFGFRLPAALRNVGP